VKSEARQKLNEKWDVLIEWWEWFYRPWRLLFVVALTVLLAILILNWLGSPMTNDLLHPDLSPPNFIEGTLKDQSQNSAALNYRVNKWRSLFQAAVLVVGLPVAFILWAWRDKNVRDQIENERKDILLKEFLEVQLRAAGALDKNVFEKGAEALQIASLHQIRIFLGRKSAGTFQRPAFELLLAGHTTDMDEMSTGQLDAIPSGRRKPDRQFTVQDPQPFFDRLNVMRVTRERMGILRDEVETLFQSAAKLNGRSAIRLNGRNFDLLDLVIPKIEGEIDISGSSFFGTKLQGSDLSNLNFSDCRLQGTDLRNTNWRQAKSYKNAYFDHFTQLSDDLDPQGNLKPWAKISPAKKKSLREELIKLGAYYRPRRRLNASQS
jgi:hypothetical protein